MPVGNGAELTPYDAQRGGWPSFAEAMVQESLERSQEPESVIKAIRPPLQQIMMFPDRFGYPTFPERQATIRGVIEYHALYPDARQEVSGGEAGYSGSERNVTWDSRF